MASDVDLFLSKLEDLSRQLDYVFFNDRRSELIADIVKVESHLDFNCKFSTGNHVHCDKIAKEYLNYLKFQMEENLPPRRYTLDQQ